VYLSWPEFDRDDLQPLARQVLRFWGAKVCELPPEVVAIGDPAPMIRTPRASPRNARRHTLRSRLLLENLRLRQQL
jgi:hypothetical protein